jgi:hypothetical protein
MLEDHTNVCFRAQKPAKAGAFRFGYTASGFTSTCRGSASFAGDKVDQRRHAFVRGAFLDDGVVLVQLQNFQI